MEKKSFSSEDKENQKRAREKIEKKKKNLLVCHKIGNIG
jgi:hypothetical protein